MPRCGYVCSNSAHTDFLRENQASPGFNGAATLTVADRQKAAGRLLGVILLQWGRDPDGRGQLRMALRPLSTRLRLQWGRDPDGRGQSDEYAAMLTGESLQWGRDPDGRGQDHSLKQGVRVDIASMGPRP